MSEHESPSKKDRGRFSSKRKTQAVLRLLQGEDLDSLSRELGVTAQRLSQWRDEFLAAGEAGLKSRQPDSRDDKIRELQAKVGELTMDLEASREAVARLKEGRPLDSGRSSS
ncbi:MAG: helix-turn-helix domain-containing protein [Spiribacter salinus]|uniref:Helix-turn-helix domain-containing protein n=1 Tax=Spiribacter salinus TaxID=1335746 RepID=A0A540VPP4_9GAMM|nr:MAG: helix-turn-helix domain-containing protein [Spiribacter salinus]